MLPLRILSLVSEPQSCNDGHYDAKDNRCMFWSHRSRQREHSSRPKEDGQRHPKSKGGIHGLDASTPTEHAAIPANSMYETRGFGEKGTT